MSRKAMREEMNGGMKVLLQFATRNTRRVLYRGGERRKRERERERNGLSDPSEYEHIPKEGHGYTVDEYTWIH